MRPAPEDSGIWFTSNPDTQNGHPVLKVAAVFGFENVAFSETPKFS
jgi:hypothetical protein